MNVKICPYSIVTSHWHNYDATLRLHDKLSEFTVRSQRRRYVLFLPLHIVTRLWKRWRLWWLWCETNNLVSPESQLLEHQAWWSRAFARTMSRHGLLFNSIGPDLAKPRLKISLLTQARPALHFFLVRPGPGLDLIWLLGPCLDNFVWTVNYFRIRFFSLFVWKKSHFIINKFYFLTTLAGQL